MNVVSETQLTAAPCIMISSLDFLSLIYGFFYINSEFVCIQPKSEFTNSELTAFGSFVHSDPSKNTIVSSAKGIAKKTNWKL